MGTASKCSNPGQWIVSTAKNSEDFLQVGYPISFTGDVLISSVPIDRLQSIMAVVVKSPLYTHKGIKNFIDHPSRFKD